MLKRMLGALWRGVPKGVRRWIVWLKEPRFAVTAGAIVLDQQGRVLLLRHVFRKDIGWGIPGGFLAKGEEPQDAVRRELREEAGLELDEIELAFIRTFKRLQQIEIVFRCRVNTPEKASPQSIEVSEIGWFAMDALPQGLSPDQCRLIERALEQSTSK